MRRYKICRRNHDGGGEKKVRVYAMPPSADELDYWSCVTDVPCPCCTSGTIRWAEAVYVSGYRICGGCGRHFLAEGTAAVRRTAEPPSRSKITNGAEETPAAVSASGEAASMQQGPIRTLQTERRNAAERRHRSRRGQRRVALQVPVRVRANSPNSQFEEITRTVNVCRNGIYIQSERPYAKGSPIYVAMNYSPRESATAPEQKATVVRVDSLAGTAARGVAIQLT